MKDILELPYPLPEGVKWVNWIGDLALRMAAATTISPAGAHTYHIWTYQPDEIGGVEPWDTEVPGNFWRVRVDSAISRNRILAHYSSFEEALTFMSNYMLLGIYAEERE